MRKIDEMKNKLRTLTTETQNLLNDNKVEEAKAKMKEIKALKDAIDLQKELDEEMKDNVKNKVPERGKSKSTSKENANIIRAMIKKVTNRTLTEAENSLLIPQTSTSDDKGISYILPTDVSTRIRKKIRQYKSLTTVVGYMPTGALSGSFPVENFETVSELIDFTDGEDGKESDDISFKNVSYSLREKAAFIKLSNTLLKMTDEDLINYVVRVFAKKAVITENKMIVEALKKDKTVKLLENWTALKSSINVDLDPSMLYETCIVTNQDGFDFLDKQLDENGRPILQPNPADATKKMFNGYPIELFSNTMLKTVKGKAPIIYGNLKEGVNFVDLKGLISFATSSEAGFMSNTTIARLIEFIDVVQVDSSDKCYIYGSLPLVATTPAA